MSASSEAEPFSEDNDGEEANRRLAKASDAEPLVENYFRHEYGRLVAMLSRRVGPQHLEAVEDAVQNALMRALESWTRGETPANPSAWLYRVAHNSLLSTLRTQTRRLRLHHQWPELEALAERQPSALKNEIDDDLLKMLFVCCQSGIPAPSQLVLALKTLCGFSVGEIAQRLFMSEANVYKRLGRALQHLRKSAAPTELNPSHERLLPAVHNVLYVLFTEGHLSSHPDFAIRRELCFEALRLTTILAKRLPRPTTHALLALMHFHVARMNARVSSDDGGLLLLEEQDRSLYDADHIRQGLVWLSKSAEGSTFSRYHAEAGIAAEHCLAKTFADTRWENVVACYELLESRAPSAIHRLNRAVAVAELKGPTAGLDVIRGLDPPPWLAGSHLWAAVLADLHRRCGDSDAAKRYRSVALELAPTDSVRRLLQKRLGRD